jgi:protein-disulfide isomerase
MSERTGWRQVALAAALVGAGISAYLLVEYGSGQSGFCATGSGCDEVRASAFAYPFGIPMPLFGLAFYLAAAWIALRSLEPTRFLGMSARVALAALALAGLAVSIVLTSIEAFVIHAFCTWCLGQAVASLVLAISSVVGLVRQGPSRQVNRDISRHAKRVAAREAARQLDAEKSGLRREALLVSGFMAIVVASLLVGGALGRGAPGPTGNPGANTTASLAPASAPRTGSGPVTVVEFADYQCPACQAVAPELQQLVTDGSITLVYRYFPLPQHSLAVLAARAAQAASLQGKFWPMHDLLFSTHAAWENLSNDEARAYLGGLASRAGLNLQRWQADLTSPAVAEAVSSDAAAAKALGLPGTPSIFINGTYYQDGLTLAQLRSAVAAANG